MGEDIPEVNPIAIVVPAISPGIIQIFDIVMSSTDDIVFNDLADKISYQQLKQRSKIV